MYQEKKDMTKENISRIAESIERVVTTRRKLASDLEKIIRELVCELYPPFATKQDSYRTLFTFSLHGRLCLLTEILLDERNDTLIFRVKDSDGRYLQYSKYLFDNYSLEQIADTLHKQIRLRDFNAE